ncbi:hypothetical protein GW943_01175 [Candidatus Parcubacteria bacterium]|uniref:Uncharacterized protein n=1 Tax=Candidatus Kaiserbacteria bacterium CG10_big_fil_rev_8_21_14_0_10_47_16 TaxID=1974608 RepID=A0A2H0UDD5_9BACT|nr:hypothetical protein [Candidatus Parcubacteria bacterium]PIR84438.1 MAG: hypothetical protein COU16_02555 [Candidatus Kaiserbacteria bacterium CG10_big_fil_rev_8_21_14_0_10_47_16]
MNTTEKQESQKTVVAFVAGLLIGGLLVWVFSSPTDTDDSAMKESSDDSAMAVSKDDSKKSDVNSPAAPSAPAMADVTAPADASLQVGNQVAGEVVVLDGATYPISSGWVVVRESEGSILGAARFDTTIGLIPQSVELLRSTEVGTSYDVVFFTDNGDKVFDTSVDLEVAGVSGTFVAQ